MRAFSDGLARFSSSSGSSTTRNTPPHSRDRPSTAHSRRSNSGARPCPHSGCGRGRRRSRHPRSNRGGRSAGRNPKAEGTPRTEGVPDAAHRTAWRVGIGWNPNSHRTRMSRPASTAGNHCRPHTPRTSSWAGREDESSGSAYQSGTGHRPRGRARHSGGRERNRQLSGTAHHKGCSSSHRSRDLWRNTPLPPQRRPLRSQSPIHRLLRNRPIPQSGPRQSNSRLRRPPYRRLRMETRPAAPRRGQWYRRHSPRPAPPLPVGKP